MCTASTTFVSVWGSGKALRGKDGSMDEAVDGMHAERAFIFSCFGVGLITTLLALMSAAWILMTLEVAIVATIGISWAIFVIIRQATRINAKFGLSRDDVVSFADIMQSAAVPSGQAQQERAGLLSGGGEEDQGDEQGELIPEHDVARFEKHDNMYLYEIDMEDLVARGRDPDTGLHFATRAAFEQIREQPPPWARLSGIAPHHEAVRLLKERGE